MSTQNDGGPAFPSNEHIFDPRTSGVLTHLGMTLRDYFAAKALVVLPHMGCGADLQYDGLASEAYGIADAMLAERAKKTKGTE